MMPLVASVSPQTSPVVTDAKLAALPAHPRLRATKTELEVSTPGKKTWQLHASAITL